EELAVLVRGHLEVFEQVRVRVLRELLQLQVAGLGGVLGVRRRAEFGRRLGGTHRVCPVALGVRGAGASVAGGGGAGLRLVRCRAGLIGPVTGTLVRLGARVVGSLLTALRLARRGLALRAGVTAARIAALT